jgi:hypothetical protein
LEFVVGFILINHTIHFCQAVQAAAAARGNPSRTTDTRTDAERAANSEMEKLQALLDAERAAKVDAERLQAMLEERAMDAKAAGRTGSSFDEAWDILQDTDAVSPGASLADVMKKLGLKKASHLRHCESDEIDTICKCLKPIPARMFRLSVS